MKKLLMITVFALIVMSTVALAEAPRVISIQGKLTNTAGNPITSAKSAVFNFYDASTSGNLLWTASMTITPDSSGIFNAEITLPSSSTLDFSKPYWVGIVVDSQTLGPRVKITSSAYTMSSQFTTGLNVNLVGLGSGAAGRNGLTIVSDDPNNAVIVINRPNLWLWSDSLVKYANLFVTNATINSTLIIGPNGGSVLMNNNNILNSGTVEANILQDNDDTILAVNDNLNVTGNVNASGNVYVLKSSVWYPVQTRVTGTCTGGAVNVISDTGTVTCEDTQYEIGTGCADGTSVRNISDAGVVGCEDTQKEIGTTCADGTAIRDISDAGIVTCEDTQKEIGAACGSGQYVTAISDTGVLTCGAPATGGVTGSGTANYVPKWTAGTVLGNSAIYDNGGIIEIPTTANYELRFTGANGANIQSPSSSMYFLAGSGAGLYFGTNNIDSRMILDTNGKLKVYGPIHADITGGNANLDTSTYEIAGTNIAGQTIYAYGSMCVGNNYGDCSNTGGTKITYNTISINDNTQLQQGNNNALRIQTNYGWVEVGSQHANWAHFITDRSAFYFAQPVYFDTGIMPYTNNSENIGSSSQIWGNIYATNIILPRSTGYVTTKFCFARNGGNAQYISTDGQYTYNTAGSSVSVTCPITLPTGTYVYTVYCYGDNTNTWSFYKTAADAASSGTAIVSGANFGVGYGVSNERVYGTSGYAFYTTLASGKYVYGCKVEYQTSEITGSGGGGAT